MANSTSGETEHVFKKVRGLFILGLATMCIGFFLLYVSLPPNESSGFGDLFGKRAQKSFFEGGDGSRLEGSWRVRWFELDETGKVIPFRVLDRKNNELVEYGHDNVEVVADGARLTCRTWDERMGEAYWLEGRISNEDYVTLLYWSPYDARGSAYVGCLTMKVTTEGTLGSTVLKGFWTGYDPKTEGDIRIRQGTVTWTRSE